MRSLAVMTGTLPGAAAALLAFACSAAAPVPVPTVDGDLQGALGEFLRAGAGAADALAAEGRRQAAAIVAAAELYRQLEQLLIPSELG